MRAPQSDGRPGVVALAWTDGVTLPAGARLLLGFIQAPSGARPALSVYGIAAAGLDDGQEIGLELER